MTNDKPTDPKGRNLPSSAPSPLGEGVVVLAVGRGAFEGFGPVIATPFRRLTRDLLNQVRPDVVAFPLVGTDCDAAQVVERLGQLEYRGLALVVAPRLPDPSMVLRELRALMPGLRIEISQRDG